MSLIDKMMKTRCLYVIIYIDIEIIDISVKR